jgi:hypothetical protein
VKQEIAAAASASTGYENDQYENNEINLHFYLNELKSLSGQK